MTFSVGGFRVSPPPNGFSTNGIPYVKHVQSKFRQHYVCQRQESYSYVNA